MQKLVSDVFQGAYKSRFKGRGMEFEEVRSYVPGDDIRTIDWNVTARTGDPFVKTFKEERELTVMLLVDLSRSCQYGTTDKFKKEIIAEIGALLAFSAIKNNDKIGLILFSDHIELYVPPRKGVRHVLRIIRELLVRQPSGNKTDLKAAFTFLGKVTSHSVICFVLSDFLAPPFDKELKVVAQKHDLIGIRIEDPCEISYPKIPLVQLKDLENGKIQLVDTSSEAVQHQFKQASQKRSAALRQLFINTGSALIEIITDKPYLDPLQKYFTKRRKRA